MNKSTHRLITRKAIEFLTKEYSGSYRINGTELSDASWRIEDTSSSIDDAQDLEFVDVDGDRDNPHKWEYGEINDVAHNQDSVEGRELTSFSHFIDIKKGPGLFDDYDGYSYQHGSAKNEQYEPANTDSALKRLGLNIVAGFKSTLVDDLVNYWMNDEYVHVPGRKWYKNCSPATWRYSFHDGLNKYPDKYAELDARFPLAVNKGKKDRGIPYSVMMPVDNLGRHWYETFLLSGDFGALGPALHAVQDATVPQHAAGYMGNFHAAYEGVLEEYADALTQLPVFYRDAAALFQAWNASEAPPPPELTYARDYGRLPGPAWRVDHLITWTAFRAYRSYLEVYKKFNTAHWAENPESLGTPSASYVKAAFRKEFKQDDAAALLTVACAMSMLVLAKAKAEFEASLPPPERKVVRIDVIHRTADKKDADTDSGLVFYLYNELCGGSWEMPIAGGTRKRGQVDTYGVTVGRYNIDAEKFHVGFGITGQNAWLPESFKITYTTEDGKTRTYADLLTWNTWFDSKFWHPIPKRPMNANNEIAATVEITHTTAKHMYAKTKASMWFEAEARGQEYKEQFPFEWWLSGSTQTHMFRVRSLGAYVDELKLGMRIVSRDGWLPEKFVIVIRNPEGKVVFSEEIRWPNNKWFKQSAASKPFHYILNG